MSDIPVYLLITLSIMICGIYLALVVLLYKLHYQLEQKVKEIETNLEYTNKDLFRLCTKVHKPPEEKKI